MNNKNLSLKYEIIKLLDENNDIKLSLLDIKRLKPEYKTRYITLLKLYNDINETINIKNKNKLNDNLNNNVDEPTHTTPSDSDIKIIINETFNYNKTNETLNYNNDNNNIVNTFNNIDNIIKINEDNNNKLIDIVNNLKNELKENNKDIFILKQKDKDNYNKINEYKKIINSLNKTINNYKKIDNNNIDDVEYNDNYKDSQLTKKINYFQIPKLTDNKINKLLLNYGCKYENIKNLNKYEKKVLFNKFRGINKLERIFKITKILYKLIIYLYNIIYNEK
jgi:hypothetical protein